MIELIQYGFTTIAVDVVGDFSPEHTAELTQHAIEDGSLINDHKIFAPLSLTLEVNQTEKPIDAPGYSNFPIPISPEPVRTEVRSPFLLAGGAIRNALFGAGNVNSFVGYRTPLAESRGTKLYDQLLELYKSEDLATITYRGRAYKNMALVSIKLVHSSTHVGLHKFMLTFTEVRTVSTALDSGLPDVAELRLDVEATKGIKSPKQIEAEARPRSAAHVLFGLPTVQ